MSEQTTNPSETPNLERWSSDRLTRISAVPAADLRRRLDDIARIAHWMLNDRGYTKAMAARDIVLAVRQLDPDIEQIITGDATRHERQATHV